MQKTAFRRAAWAVAKIALPAAVLTISPLIECSSPRQTTKIGDSTLVMQSTAQIDTSLTRPSLAKDSIPKIVVPDVEKLTTFNPYFDFEGKGTANKVYSPDNHMRKHFGPMFAELVKKINPFDLPDAVIAEIKKEPKKYNMLLDNWEKAKLGVIAALFTQKQGITPENALANHTPKELGEFKVMWADMLDAMENMKKLKSY